jgi:hypothetical protein
MRLSWSGLLISILWIAIGIPWLLVPHVPLIGRFMYGKKWNALSQDTERYKKVVRGSRSLGATCVLIAGGSLASRLLALLRLESAFIELLPLILGVIASIAFMIYTLRQR